MNRIPKKAQRAIAKANEDRQKRTFEFSERTAQIQPPAEMGPGVPRALMNLFDVYYNGEKQFLCQFASRVEGKIVRWTRSLPAGKHMADRSSPLETLYGTVEFRRR